MIKIITGKHDSGKTSYLRYLVKDSKFFSGFLEYKKYDENDEFVGYELYNIETGEKFDFITTDLSKKGIRVKDFIILKEGLEMGKKIIKEGIKKDKILVIDEVGQIQVQEKLFHNEIVKAINSDIEIYITVSKDLLNDFLMKYNLKNRDYNLIKVDY
ncbi:MAG: nucleoside-triphosphatase [Bacillota bacterium]